MLVDKTKKQDRYEEVKQMISKVYETIYDGYIIAKYDSGWIKCFEGIGLCPRTVLNFIVKNETIKLNCDCNDAIRYGYINEEENKMSGNELLNNLIDELIRAREIVMWAKEQEETADRSSWISDLINDIDADLERYNDYADSILASVEDIVVE